MTVLVIFQMFLFQGTGSDYIVIYHFLHVGLFYKALALPRGEDNLESRGGGLRGDR